MRRGRRGHGPRSGVRRGARDRGRCRAVGGRISRRCAGPRPADSAGCTGPVVFGGGGQWYESIYLVLGERRLVAPGARLAQGDGRHGQGRGTHLLNRGRGVVQAGKATCDRKAVGEPLMLRTHLDDPPIGVWNGPMPFFRRSRRWMEAQATSGEYL